MKVLVGIDGSSHSFAAVEFVGRLLAADRDEIVLLFATPQISFDDERLEPAIVERAREALSSAVLEAALERLPEAWRGRVEKRDASGAASARILEAIDDSGADLVAVGFRGTSGVIERFMMGSVSRAVVHSAKVSVLVVKDRSSESASSEPSQRTSARPIRVLVALGNPALAEKSVSLLKQFSWPPESCGWAIKVVEPMFISNLPDWVKVKRDPDVEAMAAAWEQDHRQSMQAARVELEKLRSQLPPCFSPEEVIVAEGRPADNILAQVREKSIDLVAMGSRNAGTLRTMLLGSTTDQVLRESPSSVLIVR